MLLQVGLVGLDQECGAHVLQRLGQLALLLHEPAEMGVQDIAQGGGGQGLAPGLQRLGGTALRLQREAEIDARLREVGAQAERAPVGGLGFGMALRPAEQDAEVEPGGEGIRGRGMGSEPERVEPHRILVAAPGRAGQEVGQGKRRDGAGEGGCQRRTRGCQPARVGERQSSDARSSDGARVGKLAWAVIGLSSRARDWRTMPAAG